MAYPSLANALPTLDDLVRGTGPTQLPSIQALLLSGRNGGTWDGPGIDSTGAHAGNGSTALGYSDAAGVVTVKYTRNGDADLDKTTAFADLVAVAQHYGLIGNQTWSTGDFNYDNNVDFADLVVVAQNYGLSVPSAPVASPAVSAAAVVGPAPAKVVTASKAVSTAKPIAVAKPVAVSKPVAKPVAVAGEPIFSIPFASQTPFRAQNKPASLVGDVLEKSLKSKSLFR